MQRALHGCNCIMNVAGAFNAFHTNPLNFGSCSEWFCLKKDPKVNETNDLCRETSAAVRTPATEGSWENTNCKWVFPYMNSLM